MKRICAVILFLFFVLNEFLLLLKNQMKSLRKTKRSAGAVWFGFDSARRNFIRLHPFIARMPCGAVPSHIPTPAKFQKQKELPVVESQHWHRPPAAEQCPNVSHCTAPRSACASQHGLLLVVSQRPPSPLHPASFLSDIGAKPALWKLSELYCFKLQRCVDV